jgi:hypothetical protein
MNHAVEGSTGRWSGPSQRRCRGGRHRMTVRPLMPARLPPNGPILGPRRV